MPMMHWQYDDDHSRSFSLSVCLSSQLHHLKNGFSRLVLVLLLFLPVFLVFRQGKSRALAFVPESLPLSITTRYSHHWPLWSIIEFLIRGTWLNTLRQQQHSQSDGPTIITIRPSLFFSPACLVSCDGVLQSLSLSLSLSRLWTSDDLVSTMICVRLIYCPAVCCCNDPRGKTETNSLNET